MGHTAQRSRITREALGGAAGLAAVAVNLVVIPAGAAGHLSNGMQVAAALVAAGACAAAARAVPGARLGWALLAAASLVWGFGNVAYAVGDAAGSPFPSAGDVGFLAFLPLAGLGVLTHPAGPRSRAEWARIGIDALIAGGSVRLVVWALLAEPVHGAEVAPGFDSAAGYTFAVGHFVLVALALLIAIRAATCRRASLTAVACGFFAIALGDGVYTYFEARGSYASGGLGDLLWMAGFLTIALGARLEHLGDQAEPPRQPALETVRRQLLPYAFVIPAIVAAMVVAADGDMDPVLVWNTFGVGVLLLARQVIDRLTNVRLVHSLRDTVDELRRRDLQLEEAQRIARLGSWEWDLETNDATWTDEMYRVLGLRVGEELEGLERFMLAVRPEDREAVIAHVTERVEQRLPFEFDFRPVVDSERVIHTRGRPVVDAEGRVTKLVGTVQDVTALRRLGHELERRLAELERSNSDLAHFASVASHDLAAPVQLLLGHLRLLRDRVRSGVGADDAVLVEEAIHGAQRLDELIQDILCYSLAASGDEQLRAPVDLNRAVDDAARTVGADVLAARLDVEHLPVVDAHPGQVRQLFQNLLANALKFARPGEPPTIHVWAERVDGGWQVSVADDGVGVAQGDRRRIFEMFERGERIGAGGSGIGLAICARIVTRHGGRIWADGRPGGGAIFRFELPQRRAAEAELVLTD